MPETEKVMRLSDLNSFKSMLETLNPFRNPNLDSLFPQPVLPSDVSLPSPSASGDSLQPHQTIDQDLDKNSPTPVLPSDVSLPSPSASGDSLQPHQTIDQDLDKNSPTGVVFLNDESVITTNMVQESNTAAQSLRCEICSIDCNSKSVLELHLSGKKHNFFLQKLGEPSAAENGMANEPKLIQSIRCEVCDVDCNSRDTFEKHVSGKKHQEKVKTLSVPKNTVPQVSYVDCSEALEAKATKLLDSTLPVNSVKVCTICNIGCNSQDMFNKHLAGKKHAAQVRMKSQIREQLSVKRNVISTAPRCLIFLPNDKSNGSLENTATGVKPVQFAYCDVCKIYFNSSGILGSHKLGLVHLKNLEKLAKPGTEDTNSSGLAVKPLAEDLAKENVPMEDSEPYKVNSIDLKSKNTDQPGLTLEDTFSKELNAFRGLVASKGSGTGCTICNIVCNSQTVLNSHLSGQKHAAMVKRHANTLLKNARAKIIAEGTRVVPAS